MSPSSTRPGAWGRWALAVVLALAIFALGTQPLPLFAAFTRFWQAAFGALGLGSLLERLQRGTSTQVTTRSLPAMLTYSLLYIGLCLLLLRVLLGDARRWYQALAFYGLVLVLCALLLLAGKLGGDVPVLYRTGRHLIDFITSPLPVVVLLPLLSPWLRRSLWQPPS